ncbi:MAG: hypothetical protein KME14_20500 [Tildeniella torsiva UHER 1998/13D]|nr:hypothetical protein [Tildeniella torsiva UHER 1998/13D]
MNELDDLITPRERVLALALSKAVQEIATLRGRSEAWVGQVLLAKAADELRANRLLESVSRMDLVINGGPRDV